MKVKPILLFLFAVLFTLQCHKSTTRIDVSSSDYSGGPSGVHAILKNNAIQFGGDTLNTTLASPSDWMKHFQRKIVAFRAPSDSSMKSISLQVDPEMDMGTLCRVLCCCRETGLDTVFLSVRSFRTGKTVWIPILFMPKDRHDKSEHSKQLQLSLILEDSSWSISAFGGRLPESRFRILEKEGTPKESNKYSYAFVVNEAGVLANAFYTKEGLLLLDNKAHPITALSENSQQNLLIDGMLQTHEPGTNEKLYSRPLLLQDAFMAKLFAIRQRFTTKEVPDANELVIAAEQDMLFGAIAQALYVSHTSGFSDIMVALLNSPDYCSALTRSNNFGQKKKKRPIGYAGTVSMQDLAGSVAPSGNGIDLLQLKKRGNVNFRIIELSGSRSEDEIMDVFKNNVPSIRYVYNKMLRKKPNLKGNASYRLRIIPSGGVIRCVLEESTFDDQEFEDMLVDKMLRWTFPTLDNNDTQSTHVLMEFKMGI